MSTSHLDGPPPADVKRREMSDHAASNGQHNGQHQPAARLIKPLRPSVVPTGGRRRIPALTTCRKDRPLVSCLGPYAPVDIPYHTPRACWCRARSPTTPCWPAAWTRRAGNLPLSAQRWPRPCASVSNESLAARSDSRVWSDKLPGSSMRRVMLTTILAVSTGCASNRSDEPGARIEDTTPTSRDTVNPNDTLPRVRDSVLDSAR